MFLHPEVQTAYEFEYDDFRLEDYEPYPHNPAKVTA
jgi:thymidylate synthase